ncbi:MAG: SCO family protein [Hyphomicrobiaceae bacterium]
MRYVSLLQRGFVQVSMTWLALAVALLLVVPATARDQHGRPPQGIDLKPLYSLTTHLGAPLGPGSLRRRPFAVVFGFTHCPDVCPTTLLHLKALLDDMGPAAKTFPVLFVTVDPDRDTVAVMRDYVASFDERIVGLTGSAIDIETAAHAFNAFYERQAKDGASYSVDHTTRVYLMDSFGLLADAHDPATEGKKVRDTLRRIIKQ